MSCLTVLVPASFCSTSFPRHSCPGEVAHMHSKENVELMMCLDPAAINMPLPGQISTFWNPSRHAVSEKHRHLGLGRIKKPKMCSLFQMLTNTLKVIRFVDLLILVAHIFL